MSKEVIYEYILAFAGRYSGFSIFWEMVGSGGYILAGGGWWWVALGRGGWWHSLV